jgi:hypothetical protein
MKKVWIAWLITAGGIAAFTVLAAIAPSQPLKSADTWSGSGVAIIGMLVMLPIMGIAVLVTIFALVDEFLRRTMPSLDAAKLFGWLVLGASAVFMAAVAGAVAYKLILK